MRKMGRHIHSCTNIPGWDALCAGVRCKGNVAVFAGALAKVRSQRALHIRLKHSDSLIGYEEPLNALKQGKGVIILSNSEKI